MSQNTSTNEPEQRVLHDGFWRHGRFYGSWKPGKYLFPIDSEELNRMDIFHKFFLVCRNEAPCSYPPSPEAPLRILDLGTGTGIWAIHLAEVYFPAAQVMAVDLNQIQPSLIPPNLSTKQFDIEERSWEPLMKDCDLIHLRMMLGSIQTDLWPQVYKNAFEHLTPGKGMIEHIEIDWTPHWSEDSDQPPNSAFNEWTRLFLRAMDELNRNARVSTHDTKRLLEAAGFTDFKEESMQCYVNPWAPERHPREIGRWFNLGFCHSVEAMSLMPMIEQLGMTQAQVHELCARVQKEICVLRYKAFVSLRIWTAKRPPASS